jgi:hypothetical protein
MPTVDNPGLIASALSTTNTPLGDIADQKFDESEAKNKNPNPDKEELEKKDEEVEEIVEEVEEEEEKKDDEKIEEKEEDDPDAGYFADENVSETPVETPSGNDSTMGKWVLDNLPTIPVSIVIDGKNEVVQVKRADDLPRDFDFASKYDETVFNQAIADQTNRAQSLINQWNQNQQKTETDKFNQQEDRDIQADIAGLQRQGLLAKFKYPVNDPKFADDPAVKRMQEVLDYYNTENKARWERSQSTGRLVERLSYTDAFKLWQADHVELTPTQKAEDKARVTATRKTAKAGNGTNEAKTRPNLPRNADISQIISAYGIE